MGRREHSIVKTHTPGQATHNRKNNQNCKGSPQGPRGLNLTAGSLAWESCTRNTSLTVFGFECQQGLLSAGLDHQRAQDPAPTTSGSSLTPKFQEICSQPSEKTPPKQGQVPALITPGLQPYHLLAHTDSGDQQGPEDRNPDQVQPPVDQISLRASWALAYPPGN